MGMAWRELENLCREAIGPLGSRGIGDQARGFYRFQHREAVTGKGDDTTMGAVEGSTLAYGYRNDERSNKEDVQMTRQCEEVNIYTHSPTQTHSHAELAQQRQ